jgi:hypothetical protein
MECVIAEPLALAEKERLRFTGILPRTMEPICPVHLPERRS